ncbi:MAG: response regulator transcription factor [Lachnospira sp.]
MKKIMIVEDDKAISVELKELLDNSGYEASELSDFRNACDEIIASAPDLVLLDINIPYMNGEMLLKQLRSQSDVPVIMVTSRDSEADEVLSMSYGADDYITKPYNPTILLLRINALFKRLDSKSDNSKITYRGMEIFAHKGVITFNNGKDEITLSKNEMTIFMYLLSNRDRIVSRDELMTELWNNEEYLNDNALTVNISRLRARFKEMGLDDVIETRKGQGYILS